MLKKILLLSSEVARNVKMVDAYKNQLKKIGYEKGQAEASERISKLENKIESMKQRKTPKSRYQKANPRLLLGKSRNKELKSLRQAQKKFKQRQELSKLRQSYSSRFSERAGRVLQSVAQARIQQLQTARAIRQPLLKSRFVKQKKYPTQQISPQQIQARREQQEYNNLFWSYPAITKQVENEVSGFGGVSLEGSSVANSISREVSNFGNFLMPNPTRAVENESLFFAKSFDIAPTINMEREINFFANLLS